MARLILWTLAGYLTLLGVLVFREWRRQRRGTVRRDWP